MPSLPVSPFAFLHICILLKYLKRGPEVPARKACAPSGDCGAMPPRKKDFRHSAISIAFVETLRLIQVTPARRFLIETTIRIIIINNFHMWQDLRKHSKFYLFRKLTLKIYFGGGRRISLKQDNLVY